MHTNVMKSIFAVLIIFIAFSALAAKQEYSVDEELMYRINFGTANDVKILLDQGANPNAISKNGEYAISVAIGRDDNEAIEIVKLLLDKGAKPNVIDRSNTYPIVSAAINNKTEIVASLLAKGADFHSKSANGRSIIDIAKSNNNPEMIKIVQKVLDDEAAFNASLHTPERFMSFIHSYIYYACTFQYWNFVKGSQQMPEKDFDTDEKIKRINNDLSSTIEQIQRYYPTTPTADLQRVVDFSSKKIFDTLDGMISNTNRVKQGVGTDQDADKRCLKIIDDIKIEFPPSVYK